MKEIVVLSGKGGTGKTSVVGALAAIVEQKVLVDCDVDAADLHLLLNPETKTSKQFWSGQVASIDPIKCTECGLCQDLCRFHAIKDYIVDEISCEGCGFCFQVCPVEAVEMKDNLSGHLFVSNTRYGPLVHARLGIAQENSGKLVAEVRRQAKQIAENEGLEYIIIDGPPGIGCPVISSLSGVNTALLITEPTLSGMHDLERVLELCEYFNVPAQVCINKYDINKDNTEKIESYCSARNVAITAKIPFDTVVTKAMVQGMTVVEYSKNVVSQEIEKLWNNICEILRKDNGEEKLADI